MSDIESPCYYCGTVAPLHRHANPEWSQTSYHDNMCDPCCKVLQSHPSVPGLPIRLASKSYVMNASSFAIVTSGHFYPVDEIPPERMERKPGTWTYDDEKRMLYLVCPNMFCLSIMSLAWHYRPVYNAELGSCAICSACGVHHYVYLKTSKELS